MAQISVLTPDLSHNCLGRSYLLAELLSAEYEVEIVGPKLEGTIWAPLRGEYDYRSFSMNASIVEFFLNYPKERSLITGDILYATKPRMTSFGYGLLSKTLDDRNLILDIDDWETGFLTEQPERSSWVTYLRSLPMMVDVNSINYMRLLERETSRADELTVSNSFLREKFGGALVPHVRDTHQFDSTRYDLDDVRKELGLPTNRFIVMFSGTPRPHKGVHHLISAINRLDRKDVDLAIVGVHESDYIKKLKRDAGDNVRFIDQQPFDQLPKWLAAAHIIVIPQLDSPSTQGQIPAKLYDAMAMGKPIVSTAVSDIPDVLGDCGLVVEPGSSRALADGISTLLEDSSMREQLGDCAREKSVSEFSYRSARDTLYPIVERLATG